MMGAYSDIVAPFEQCGCKDKFPSYRGFQNVFSEHRALYTLNASSCLVKDPQSLPKGCAQAVERTWETCWRKRNMYKFYLGKLEGKICSAEFEGKNLEGKVYSAEFEGKNYVKVFEQILEALSKAGESGPIQ